MVSFLLLLLNAYYDESPHGAPSGISLSHLTPKVQAVYKWASGYPQVQLKHPSERFTSAPLRISISTCPTRTFISLPFSSMASAARRAQAQPSPSAAPTPAHSLRPLRRRPRKTAVEPSKPRSGHSPRGKLQVSRRAGTSCFALPRRFSPRNGRRRPHP